MRSQVHSVTYYLSVINSFSLLCDCETKSHGSLGILFACDAYNVLPGLQRDLTHFDRPVCFNPFSFDFIVASILVSELQACEKVVLKHGDLRDGTIFKLADTFHVLAVSILGSLAPIFETKPKRSDNIACRKRHSGKLQLVSGRFQHPALKFVELRPCLTPFDNIGIDSEDW